MEAVGECFGGRQLQDGESRPTELGEMWRWSECGFQGDLNKQTWLEWGTVVTTRSQAEAQCHRVLALTGAEGGDGRGTGQWAGESVGHFPRHMEYTYISSEWLRFVRKSPSRSAPQWRKPSWATETKFSEESLGFYNWTTLGTWKNNFLWLLSVMFHTTYEMIIRCCHLARYLIYVIYNFAYWFPRRGSPKQDLELIWWELDVTIPTAAPLCSQGSSQLAAGENLFLFWEKEIIVLWSSSPYKCIGVYCKSRIGNVASLIPIFVFYPSYQIVCHITSETCGIEVQFFIWLFVSHNKIRTTILYYTLLYLSIGKNYYCKFVEYKDL